MSMLVDYGRCWMVMMGEVDRQRRRRCWAVLVVMLTIMLRLTLMMPMVMLMSAELAMMIVTIMTIRTI